MAFDGGFLHKITHELGEACESHIDKIYQPSKDELVFLLRKKGFVKRLFVSLKPGAARIQFTEGKIENPDTPPMFCMLMRKHLSSARLVSVCQPGLERIVILTFSGSNEMGDRVELKLICELIGNQANMILLNQDGRIVDCLRRSDLESGTRMVQPGAIYEYPAPQNKLDPLSTGITELAGEILQKSDLMLSRAILETVDGFSPLICREVAFKCAGNDIPVCDITDREYFTAVLSDIVEDIKNGGKPLLLTKSGGSSHDFSFTDISQYGDAFEKRFFVDYSAMLDAFYGERENAARIHHAAQSMVKLITNHYNRTQKKLGLRLEELKKCENRDQARIYGELLKANLYAVTAGSRFVEVQNYYDENLSLIRIPLNPALSASANAAKYFKDYKKSYTAEQSLTALTEEDRKDLTYFESVLESISRCTVLSELEEIREELADAGYIRQSAVKKRKKPSPAVLTEYRSAEGYRILVGKNNRQNDYLTCSLASKGDMWFHAKNIPGCHVVVFCGGEALSDETVRQAAGIAAYHSKAGASTQVPVDYTPVKYVKKPNGAKPGMVIYTTNKTIYVKPEII